MDLVPPVPLFFPLLPHFPQAQGVWTLLSVFPALLSGNSLLPDAPKTLESAFICQQMLLALPGPEQSPIAAGPPGSPGLA